MHARTRATSRAASRGAVAPTPPSCCLCIGASLLRSGARTSTRSCSSSRTCCVGSWGSPATSHASRRVVRRTEIARRSPTTCTLLQHHAQGAGADLRSSPGNLAWGAADRSRHAVGGGAMMTIGSPCLGVCTHCDPIADGVWGRQRRPCVPAAARDSPERRRAVAAVLVLVEFQELRRHHHRGQPSI
eukprot:COSAG01_NODE_767_length_13740_cov_525.281651_9_plen_187_part_00